MVDERDDTTGEGRTPPTTPSPSVDPSRESRTAPTSTPSPPLAGEGFRAGQVLGDRYEIGSRLGAGGMGEVWLATDLRLRIDVALKSVRPDYLTDERLRDLLRREVLAAREVQSPNVCRVFDLQVMESMELVSMEYVAGRTLAELLKDRTPLPLREARDIAAQFLAGLEAVHDAGLVHRDFKPENVMITPVGRVVVMDLGLAARPELMDGGAAGTPAYMPPEQSRGGSVDARADVFAAGVVLAEMIAPAGIRDREKRITLWEGLRSDPPRIPEGPWTPVIRKALSREPGDRFGSARELSRELDGLTLRVEEGESIEPYPGLAAFTEENAERFFGREGEVEALLRKLGRARLLAIAGPSGAGKTSFVQAGVIPALPEEWGHLVVHPGDRPFEALTRGLAEGRRVARRGGGQPPRHPEGAVPGFSPDGSLGRANGEILRRVARDGAPQDDGGRAGDGLVGALRRWREDHDQALLVFDQFEELFTLNAPDIQRRFAEFLGRLPLEADVHVVLSMRDDFFFRCQEHEALAPAFAEVTPLGHPTGAALRRALVQPALSCGYRFEDEALVEAMLGQVEHQRGALPLLAFAARRLWEKRDREEGTLTRSAYEEIGGVGGALAHHAEETLQRIGPDRVPIVRELFRNLVTAESTRAARDREELLSVFASSDDVAREAAAEVLDALIDARLLTSYETREAAGASEGGDTGTVSTAPVSTSSGGGATVLRRRIEIIHESLLAAWPRLVRWQAQDADAAQLRDQLRQAADAWNERDRSKDLLWTGSAYREFALWRERYPGGLSATEEAFARAMRQHADRARRIRRVAGVAVVVVLAAVAATMALLWRGSEAALERAEAEVRQREAAEILSVGRLRLEGYPSAALAHAIASLERADNEPARRFAVEALWKGPPVYAIGETRVEDGAIFAPTWSPDGRWLAAFGGHTPMVLIDGHTGEVQRPHTEAWSGAAGFSGDSSRLVTFTERPYFLRSWSLPEVELLAEWPQPWPADVDIGWGAFVRGRQLFVSHRDQPSSDRPAAVRVRSLDGGAERDLGRWPRGGGVDPEGEWLAWVEGGRVVKVRVDAVDGEPRLLGRHENGRVIRWLGDGRLVTRDAEGELRFWSAEGGLERAVRTATGAGRIGLDTAGRYAAVVAASQSGALSRHGFGLLDLSAPRGVGQATLLADELQWINTMRFHPRGDLLASGHAEVGIMLWNLATPRSLVFADQPGPGSALAFTPDGRLVWTSDQGTVKLFPLWGDLESGPRTLREGLEPRTVGVHLAVSRDGRLAVVFGRFARQVIVLPLDGSPGRVQTVLEEGGIESPALSPEGDRLALRHNNLEELSLAILDLESGDVRPLREEAGDPECAKWLPTPLWLPDGRLMSEGSGGLRLWDVEEGTSRQLRPCRKGSNDVRLASTPDGGTIVSLYDSFRSATMPRTLAVFDTATGVSREILDHGDRLTALAVDPAGTILVTGDSDGVIRVGPLSGGQPHLLYGHTRRITDLAVSPDGRWIASTSNDDTIRLWPMPDATKPPLHTLPLDELLPRLRSFTNLRVQPDPESATGYKVVPGPSPAWKTLPTW